MTKQKHYTDSPFRRIDFLEIAKGRASILSPNFTAPIKPVAYFAHSKNDYGTKREKDAIKFLSQNYRVFCPNNNLGETGDMDNYVKVSEWCDLVVVLEHKGMIGKGVFVEVKAALYDKRLALVLRKNKLHKITDIKGANERDWRNYAKLVVKK
jgi:hypothetical protein